MAKKQETEEIKKLKEKLLLNRRNGYFQIADEKVKKAELFCEDYKKFLDLGKTEREVVGYAVLAAEKPALHSMTLIKSTTPATKFIIITAAKPLSLL